MAVPDIWCGINIPAPLVMAGLFSPVKPALAAPDQPVGRNARV